MTNNTTAYPLCWPPGEPRTESKEIKRAKFSRNNDKGINQWQDDTDLLWELQHLNKLIIEDGPLHLYTTFRDEDLLLVCEKGAYGCVT